MMNGDIVDDFSTAIGLGLDAQRAKVSANESLSFETMNVLLLLNASRHKDNKELRRKLIATGKKRDAERVPMLSRADASQFLSRFDDVNRRFFSQYVDGALAKTFGPGFRRVPGSGSQAAGAQPAAGLRLRPKSIRLRFDNRRGSFPNRQAPG